MSSRSVTIVGGGIIGAASAHYLAKDGWTVTLVDSGLYGSACSHGNCGLFAPSHSLPLAALTCTGFVGHGILLYSLFID